MPDAICPRCAHNHGDPWAWLPDTDPPVTQHCKRCDFEFTTITDKDPPMPITATSLRAKKDWELKSLQESLQLTAVEKSWLEAEESRRARADKSLDNILKSVRRCTEEGNVPGDVVLKSITGIVAPGDGTHACERLRLAGDMLNAMGLISRNEGLAKALGEIIGVPANSATVLNAAGTVGQLLLALSRLRT